MGSSSYFALVFCVLCVVAAPCHGSLFGSSDDTPVGRFKSYLRIATVHPVPDYKPPSDFLLAQAKEIGLEGKTLEYVKGKPVTLLTWMGTSPSLPSILLNSHVDVVPAEKDKWEHEPFAAVEDAEGNIFARGSQDMKCVGMQYLEAIRNLKAQGFKPTRTIHLSYVPDEEVGGVDGAGNFIASKDFQNLNVGVNLDEGLASPGESYRVFNGERSPWWLKIKTTGAPGHGSKLYDDSAFENLLKSLDSISKYRAEQFSLVKKGLRAEGEVTSINGVFLKAGTPTPTGFVMNLQPSEAEAGFDIRIPPLGDVDDLQRRIDEDWAPASRNFTYSFEEKVYPRDKSGRPAVTTADDSNPWWVLLKNAVVKAGGKLSKPEIFPAATDSRYVRQEGIIAFGFSPMANTPILLHDHNEFLNAKEYTKGIAVYEEIIKAYSSYAPDVDSQAEL
ncbi:hypothetical protein M758_3G124100 [Ceratodon purpureus]|uniref:N-acyl-aliphatic-L-amino acid amidohydrolase n=1 Tax=Ceratodon purpureus TaxID=3225 RepID=A0A8T0ILE0_CERPU|nr:hypothetical protein KC19_3G122600 [Ceratodon purpureus]KAG0622797.1 hypothetical protein M758_3G124100 [Ceratodon purpureus]